MDHIFNHHCVKGIPPGSLSTHCVGFLLASNCNIPGNVYSLCLLPSDVPQKSVKAASSVSLSIFR